MFEELWAQDLARRAARDAEREARATKPDRSLDGFAAAVRAEHARSMAVQVEGRRAIMRRVEDLKRWLRAENLAPQDRRVYEREQAGLRIELAKTDRELDRLRGGRRRS